MEIKVKEKTVENPVQVAKIIREVLNKEQENDQKKEHFWVIGLNSRNRIEYLELVSLGSLNSSIVEPREVFRLAIMKRVASIILGHNHPSGDVEPSEDDLTMTGRLKGAGEILGIEVQDHIIIGGKRHFSFKERGIMS